MFLTVTNNWRLLHDNWGFHCECGGCSRGDDEATASLLARISSRLRETVSCVSSVPDLGLAFKLHTQKMVALAKMVPCNHQQLLTSHQVFSLF